IMDFPENSGNVIADGPLRITLFEFAEIADVPDMISASIVLRVGQIKLAPRDLLTDFNRFKHGTIAFASSTHVVNLANPGSPENGIECRDQVRRMDVVADLLTLVSENGIGRSRCGAFHEIRQKPVQLGS